MLDYLKKISYVLTLLVPSVIFGAQAYFVVPQNSVGVGKEALVEVYVDTENISANAVEGSIVFPSNIEVVDVKNGNSSINFWVDQPHVVGKGSVVFSGIVSGGITGRVYLFSIMVKPLSEEDMSFNFGSMQVLQNDGTGNELKVNTIPGKISVVGGGVDMVEEKVDFTAPEGFKPEIAQNDEMFEGKYFLVFATQDKGSGIDYYEVREGFFGTYTKAESPYVLNNQKLDTKVYVKAIDKKGNERVAVVNPQNPKSWYRDYTILGILLVVCLLGFFIKKIRRKFVSV